jgi:hypothetical protein
MESGVLYISLHSGHFKPFTDKNYFILHFMDSRVWNTMCAWEILNTKQNLTLLSKQSKDVALQVPFLTSGLCSLMAIAFVFVELYFKDSLLQSGYHPRQNHVLSWSLAFLLRIISPHFSQDCR